jgi:hypothetical protein
LGKKDDVSWTSTFELLKSCIAQAKTGTTCYISAAQRERAKRNRLLAIQRRDNRMAVRTARFKSEQRA